MTSDRRLLGIWSLRGWGVGLFSLPIHMCYFAMGYMLLRGVPRPSLLDLLLLVLCFELYFAYGVIVNDLFDRQVDIAAGKSSPKRGHTLTERELGLLLALLLLSSLVLVAAIGGGPVFDTLWALAFALATLYSAPPARLRARGFLGLVADSLIEKPLPVLIVFSLFGYYGPEAFLFAACAELMDSVFKHQVEDYDLDTKVGMRTFAVALGRERSDSAVQAIVHPLNILAVAALVATALFFLPGVRLFTSASVAILLLGLGATVFLERRGRMRQGFPFQDPPVVGYLDFSFRAFFLGGLALGLAVAQPGFALLSLLILFSIAVYLKGFARLFPDLFRYAASGAPAGG